MKITAVEPILVAVPDRGAPAEGAWARPAQILFVKVDTDAGITGWGEAFSYVGAPLSFAAVQFIAPYAVGREANDIAILMADLARRLQHICRNGPVASALSGLDIALWDIAGKAAGQPVWRLLGGTGNASIPAYASMVRLERPAEVARIAERCVGKGYRHIKLHEQTVEAVAAARQAVGPDVTVLLDTNCAWTTVAAAIDIARQFEPYDLGWFEEPVYPPDDFEALARIRAAAKMPIAGGENLGNVYDARRMTDAGSVDVIQPSVGKMGGITELWTAMTYAESKGIRAVPHSPYAGPALIATLHVVAAKGSRIAVEHRDFELDAYPIGEGVIARDGSLRVPDAPGLGLELDHAVIERYRVQ